MFGKRGRFTQLNKMTTAILWLEDIKSPGIIEAGIRKKREFDSQPESSSVDLSTRR